MNREIVIVLGKTGQGKSVWTRRFLEQANRLFMFDPLMDTDVQYISKDDLLMLYDNGYFNIGRKFRVGFYNQEDLDLLGSMAFVCKSCWLGIEECATAFPYGNYVRDPWMRECIFLGRHREVNMVLTAQRAQSIPIIIRSQASRIVSFCQQEGRDMQWMYDYFGSRANEISTLQRLECLDCYNGEISRYTVPLPEKSSDVNFEEIDSNKSLNNNKKFDDEMA